MTGCMFSINPIAPMHVRGPVEDHAQIPESFFVKKGGTANIRNRIIFNRGVSAQPRTEQC